MLRQDSSTEAIVVAINALDEKLDTVISRLDSMNCSEQAVQIAKLTERVNSLQWIVRGAAALAGMAIIGLIVEVAVLVVAKI